MKCFNHEKVNAVAQCGHCGINMCKECYSGYTMNNRVICKTCANKINKEVKFDESLIKKDVLLVISFWIYYIFVFIISSSLLTKESYLQSNSLFWMINHSSEKLFICYSVYIIYRVWRYIPSLSQFIPILFGNIFLMIIISIIIFMISLFWWLIYSLFIFPILYIRYLDKKYGNINTINYTLKTTLIFILIAFIYFISKYNKII